MLHQVNVKRTVAASLSLNADSLANIVHLHRKHLGMRQTKAKSDSIDFTGKPHSMFVLEVNWQSHTASQRHLQHLVRVHDLNRENVRNEHVQHRNLV